MAKLPPADASSGPQDVKEILREWLEEHGYDGLRTDDAECGCLLDNLLVCDAPCDSCQPGYRGPDPSGESDCLVYLSREDAEAFSDP